VTGISEIAVGDEGDDFVFIPLLMSMWIHYGSLDQLLEVLWLDELHPEDAEMMFWYEQEEPGQSPHLIDPAARAAANAKRRTVSATP